MKNPEIKKIVKSLNTDEIGDSAILMKKLLSYTGIRWEYNLLLISIFSIVVLIGCTFFLIKKNSSNMKIIKEVINENNKLINENTVKLDGYNNILNNYINSKGQKIAEILEKK